MQNSSLQLKCQNVESRTRLLLRRHLTISDPKDASNIAHYMTGIFVDMKLDYFQNFMQKECSIKCL